MDLNPRAWLDRTASKFKDQKEKWTSWGNSKIAYYTSYGTDGRIEGEGSLTLNDGETWPLHNTSFDATTVVVDSDFPHPDLTDLLAVKLEKHDSVKQIPIALTRKGRAAILLRHNKSKTDRDMELRAFGAATGSFLSD